MESSSSYGSEFPKLNPKAKRARKKERKARDPSVVFDIDKGGEQ